MRSLGPVRPKKKGALRLLEGTVETTVGAGRPAGLPVSACFECDALSSAAKLCHAFTAPEVMPSMYSLELNENMIRSGIVAMTKPAIIAP